ncbi:hypothetical protein AOQ84DRAFT_9994 [Glonium stellatum]|uniref:Uncharacterized protein n=1 Tax=Glonium stellatum TaxID=574774 RepID=A0A8E2JLA6_9PEZI|nr:hypothetical protein AOQ84DRAFT_9994 [Glonium stellatum]
MTHDHSKPTRRPPAPTCPAIVCSHQREPASPTRRYVLILMRDMQKYVCAPHQRHQRHQRNQRQPAHFTARRLQRYHSDTTATPQRHHSDITATLHGCAAFRRTRRDRFRAVEVGLASPAAGRVELSSASASARPPPPPLSRPLLGPYQDRRDPLLTNSLHSPFEAPVSQRASFRIKFQES